MDSDDNDVIVVFDETEDDTSNYESPAVSPLSAMHGRPRILAWDHGHVVMRVPVHHAHPHA